MARRKSKRYWALKPISSSGPLYSLGTLSSLTNRELQILQLIGDGLSTQEIADKLHRSVKTIEWHRVASTEDFRNSEAKAVTLSGRSIGLFRASDSMQIRVRRRPMPSMAATTFIL